jgi:hypothetical protein
MRRHLMRRHRLLSSSAAAGTPTRVASHAAPAGGAGGSGAAAVAATAAGTAGT